MSIFTWCKEYFFILNLINIKPNIFQIFVVGVFFLLSYSAAWERGGRISQNMQFICTYVVNDNSFILVKRALYMQYILTTKPKNNGEKKMVTKMLIQFVTFSPLVS